MDNLNIGWQLLFIGMGTVFLMLAVLSIIIYFLKYLNPKKRDVNPVNEVKPQTIDNKIPPQKVAAIMAAIKVVMGDGDYRVISIKPVNSSSWKQPYFLGGQEFKYGGRKGK